MTNATRQSFMAENIFCWSKYSMGYHLCKVMKAKLLKKIKETDDIGKNIKKNIRRPKMTEK